ncbi:mechanosensitive ion channel family protein [Clostridium ganghwense]|uniref:Mechanosensitive ion channel family protein n=1 Tax=Clostridium ganghwense TaxID=312089 RepID=A0ABT4CUI3_9CLOT|nr:mechanosensitive ion channel family protein [Clostridium ganghwense]MCY6372717.1 mechanosensitive ion channel family protein [Clostridium ganghwense]
MNGVQDAFNHVVQKVNFFTDKITIDTFKYIGIGIGVFFIFILLRKLFTKYILRVLLKFTGKTKTNLDKKIIEAFQEPIRSFFIVIGAYFALLFFGGAFGVNLYKSQNLTNLFKTATVTLIAWGCYNLTKEHSILYAELSHKFSIKLDKIVFPFLSKILRFIIIALALSIILEIWGYNINGFIAGLGIGGFAFAFAAKDVLGNIFGGFVIILDKPFSIGDYIKTPNVEGIVEDITFRSTKIRTLDKALVTEPNSTLANAPIINWTRRNMRRINFTLGVTYDTSKEQLKNCINRIREMLIKDPEISNETILVNFDNFGDSSLDIFIYCFTNTTDWAKYLQIKENVNFKIMDILESEGVSAAFPSTSVYFETPLINKDNIEIKKNTMSDKI